jgi:hypothetical protein
LTTISNNGISPTTYKNICNLAKDVVKKENARSGLQTLLLEMELQDYFIIMNALEACNLSKEGLPIRNAQPKLESYSSLQREREYEI